ncbi:MAG TPA: hypothetical protein VK507_02385 [Iamia sp.]|nr:hypothetical protein [Iamia sp.]
MSAPVTEIAPDDRFRAIVRLTSAAATALSVALCIFLVSQGFPLFFPCALIGLAAIPLLGSLNRGDLRRLRITAQGLDLLGEDGVLRSIDGRLIGGVAVTGPVIAGRLAALPIGMVPNMIGRIVVVDHNGRTVCARRAGWMRVADVEALARTAGVPWGGKQARRVPGISTPPPPGMEAPLGGSALDDAATAAMLAPFRRRRHRVALVCLAIPAVGIAALVVLSNLPADAPGRLALGWFGGLALGAFLFTVPIALIQVDEARRPRSLLRGATWWPVEAVVVSGLITDQTARLVAVPHPATGDLLVWKVAEGGGRGWLQGDDRTWFWLAVDPRRGDRKAVIAPPDRSDVALLERRLLGGIAIAEVRVQIQGEAAEWHQREAWAAWAAAQHQLQPAPSAAHPAPW